MKMSDLRKRVESICIHKKNLLEALRDGIDNPQMKECYDRESGSRNAYLAVLDAINGRPYLLDCDLYGRVDISTVSYSGGEKASSKR